MMMAYLMSSNILGTSPFQVDSNPVQVGVEDVAAGGEIIHLIYPRRADISPSYF